VRIRAEDVKAKPGTGGKPCWLPELDNPAKKGKVPYHYWLRKLGGLASGESWLMWPKEISSFPF